MLFVANEGNKGSLTCLRDKTTVRNYNLGVAVRHGATFCPIEEVVVAFQARGTAFFLSPHTQQPVQRSFTPEQVLSCATSTCGTFLIGGGQNGTILVWSLRTGQLVKMFRGHLRGITSVAVSRDNSLVLTTSEDSMCKVWPLGLITALSTQTDVSPLSSFSGHTLSVLCGAFLTQRALVVTGSADKTCRVFDAVDAEQVASYTIGDAVTCVAVSEDDTLLAVGTRAGYLYFRTLSLSSGAVALVGTAASVPQPAPRLLPPSEDGHNSPLVFARFCARETSKQHTTTALWADRGAPVTTVLTASEGGAVLWYDALSGQLVGEALPQQRQKILCCTYTPECEDDGAKITVPTLSKNPMDPTAKGAYTIHRDAKRPRREGKFHNPGKAATDDGNAEESLEDHVQGEITALAEKNEELRKLRDRMRRKLEKLN